MLFLRKLSTSMHPPKHAKCAHDNMHFASQNEKICHRCIVRSSLRPIFPFSKSPLFNFHHDAHLEKKQNEMADPYLKTREFPLHIPL